jgi:hypothetical protein
MTNEQKTTPAEPSNLFDISCCDDRAAMTEKLAAQKMQGCDCAGMMARMRAMCGGAKSETAAPEAPGTPDTVV